MNSSRERSAFEQIQVRQSLSYMLLTVQATQVHASAILPSQHVPVTSQHPYTCLWNLFRKLPAPRNTKTGIRKLQRPTTLSLCWGSSGNGQSSGNEHPLLAARVGRVVAAALCRHSGQPGVQERRFYSLWKPRDATKMTGPASANSRSRR
ncbi:unnamed protein product, partial [Phaeothamnion confervicola]